MGSKKGPPQKAVDELVAGYLIEAVRSHAGEDEDLLDRVLSLQDLVMQREGGEDVAERARALRQNPLVRGAISAMGPRVERLVEVGARVAEDAQALRVGLRERLAERGLDPADDDEHEECVAEYERVLAETVPLPRALENIEAVAELVDLAGDVLNPGGGLKARIYDLAWSAGKRMIFDDPAVLERVEALKAEVVEDPERLPRIAGLIRREGPKIVKGAYARAASAAKAARPKAAAPAAKKPTASATGRSPARKKP